MTVAREKEKANNVARSNPGCFITLEGSEGAGKSTNLDAVCAVLDSHGIDFYQTREPGGTPMSEAIRDVMLQSWDEQVTGLTELLLMFAARQQHVTHEIRPRLSSGQWVVCDRFTDASYAYQGAARGLPEEYLNTLETWVHNDLQPDLTLYLDLDPLLGAQRIANRAKDRMENEQRVFFQAVREGYLARAKRFDRITTVDAAQPLEAVGRQVTAAVETFLHHQGVT
ncbi:MAG: dTMP kinase [Gammaproteobacteria bacterium]|nr:dTMP kinase [Gammaproteobacteria bacterium]